MTIDQGFVQWLQTSRRSELAMTGKQALDYAAHVMSFLSWCRLKKIKDVYSEDVKFAFIDSLWRCLPTAKTNRYTHAVELYTQYKQEGLEMSKKKLPDDQANQLELFIEWLQETQNLSKSSADVYTRYVRKHLNGELTARQLAAYSSTTRRTAKSSIRRYNEFLGARGGTYLSPETRQDILKENKVWDCTVGDGLEDFIDEPATSGNAFAEFSTDPAGATTTGSIITRTVPVAPAPVYSKSPINLEDVQFVMAQLSLTFADAAALDPDCLERIVKALRNKEETPANLLRKKILQSVEKSLISTDPTLLVPGDLMTLTIKVPT